VLRWRQWRSRYELPNLPSVILCHARRLLVVGLLAALAVVGCGGGEGETSTDGVREAALAYVRALQTADWERACRQMTATARREVGGAAGESCPLALAGGGVLSADQLASAVREVAGARVQVRGRAATIGPLGAFRQPLRLERVAGRWFVAG
jgi:hypothetical protein